MAKGDVIMKFDAETAAYVQKVTAAVNVMQQGAHHARSFGDEVAKAGEKAERAFDSIKDLAGEAATGLAGVTTGMEALRKSVEEIQEIRQKQQKLVIDDTRSVNASLAAAGQLGAAPQVRAALDQMVQFGGATINPEERNQLFNAIARGSPYAGGKQGANWIEATRSGLIALEQGADLETATRIGTNYAQLSNLRDQGGLTGTDEQLRNQAFTLPQGLDDQQLRFIRRARDKSQALRLVAAAARSSESSRGLLAIEAAEEQTLDPTEIRLMERQKHLHPRKWTAEDERKLRLAQTPRDQIIQAMLEDETLAPAEQRAALRSLRTSLGQVPGAVDVEEQGKRLRGAADYQTVLERQAAQREAREAGRERVGAIQTAQEQEREDAEVEMQRAGLPKGLKWLASLRLAVGRGFEPLWGDPGYQPVEVAPRSPNTAAGSGGGDAAAAAIREHTAAVKEMTQALRKRSETTLSNNSEGQK